MKLPDEVPVFMAYRYADGRVFYVEQDEAKKHYTGDTDVDWKEIKMMMGVEKILVELKSWNKPCIMLLFRELLQDGNISFDDLYKSYIGVLEEQRHKENTLKSKFIYLLSATADPKGSCEQWTKEARRFLYENRFMAGSPYAEELEKEFGSKTKTNDNE